MKFHQIVTMKNIAIILSVFCSSAFVFGQELNLQTIVSGGDYYESSQGSISQTIGEVVTETYSDNNNALTQGFQQSNFNVTGIEEWNNDKDKFRVFPNPSVDFINVELESLTSKGVIYSLVDANGKEVKDGISQSNKFVIDFSGIAQGVYFLKVKSATEGFGGVYRIEKIK